MIFCFESSWDQSPLGPSVARVSQMKSDIVGELSTNHTSVARRQIGSNVGLKCLFFAKFGRSPSCLGHITCCNMNECKVRSTSSFHAAIASCQEFSIVSKDAHLISDLSKSPDRIISIKRPKVSNSNTRSDNWSTLTGANCTLRGKCGAYIGDAEIQIFSVASLQFESASRNQGQFMLLNNVERVADKGQEDQGKRELLRHCHVRYLKIIIQLINQSLICIEKRDLKLL